MNTHTSVLPNDLILLIGNFTGYEFKINENILKVKYNCNNCRKNKKQSSMRKFRRKTMLCKKCLPLKYHKPQPYMHSGKIFDFMLKNINYHISFEDLQINLKPKHPDGKCFKQAFKTLLHFGHIGIDDQGKYYVRKNNKDHIYY